VALLLAGCSDNGNGTLTLSWVFADGRRCTDAGVYAVLVRASEDLGSFRCTDGTAPGTIQVPNVPRDGHITIFGLSPQNTELYRAELNTDVALEPTTVTFYATGAR
jgi:hypothetical protein